MARWIIVRDEEVKLYYENLITNIVYPLGSVERDVSDDMVVEWIFKQAQPQFGDRIHLSDGSMLVFQRGDALA